MNLTDENGRDLNTGILFMLHFSCINIDNDVFVFLIDLSFSVSIMSQDCLVVLISDGIDYSLTKVYFMGVLSTSPFSGSIP